jgi:ABC-type sugar transport system ATPase subunit
MTTPALFSEDVWMRFGQTVAVRSVDLEVEPGTIRGLIGENGAGKSTFLGIIAGRLRPSAGRIEVAGAPMPLGSPRLARRHGVAAIYQELALVPALSAVANVFLGAESVKGGVLSERGMRRRFRELSDRLGAEIGPDTPVRDLSVGDQQMIEILRGVHARSRLLLLDEPTSALERPERDRLFRSLRELRSEGVTSIFVSHDLDDVLEVTDQITIFRDGAVVSSEESRLCTKGDLVRVMLGGAAAEISHLERSTPEPRGISMNARDVELPGKLEGINLEVRAGEIVGLGGLAGSGRSSLLRTLAGATGGATKGSLQMAGGKVRGLPRSTGEASRLGIGLIPEDRKHAGLVPGMTAVENIMLPGFAGVGLISRKAARRTAAAAAERVGFDPGRLETEARHLSGGNQQKLLLARWAIRDLEVLLADEPTRGVDLGAKAEILQTLNELAYGGLSILIASSDLEDLEAIADRVIVLSGGEMRAELSRERAEINAGRILHAAFDTSEQNEGMMI